MRSYKQFCPAARALDVVGERWTLLIIRELLFGPQRYTDLQAGLPGIGPNVLAERLRALEAADLIRKRRLPPPAASTVYELTELGSELRPVLHALFRWGLQLIDEPSAGEAIKASYWLPAIQAAARPDVVAADVADVYEFHIGDEVLAIRVSGGNVIVEQGAPDTADLVVRTDHATFASLGMGRISPQQAIETGRLSVEGDPVAAQRCAAIFDAAAADQARASA